MAPFEYGWEVFCHMIEVERGNLIRVRDVMGAMLERRALTGVTRGGDFPVVWACSEREWEAARAEGREPDGIPWPAEDVVIASDAAWSP